MTTSCQELLHRIVNDDRYKTNTEWGHPRPGHPEGTIRAHIEELERNLSALENYLPPDSVDKLRLLIHTHDTFKSDASPDVPIAHAKSHASLAKKFLSEFIDDQDMLNMVQFHDEPFALYRQVQTKGKYDQDRLDTLVKTVRDWDLFLVFSVVDGMTEGKDRKPLDWFINEIRSKVNTKVNLEALMSKVVTSKS